MRYPNEISCWLTSIQSQLGSRGASYITCYKSIFDSSIDQTHSFLCILVTFIVIICHTKNANFKVETVCVIGLQMPPLAPPGYNVYHYTTYHAYLPFAK